MLGGAMFNDYSARVLLLIVGMTPLQLVFAVITLDMWCVLCEARDRRAQP
jgi:hypothetical protein